MKSIYMGGKIGLVGILLLLSGCGGSTYPTVEWSGTVTIGGQPIPSDAVASIEVVSLEASAESKATQADIVGGNYTLKDVPVGNVLVQFNIVREIPAKNPTDQMRGIRSYSNLVPGNFAGFSEKAEQDDTQKNFDIQGGKK